MPLKFDDKSFKLVYVYCHEMESDTMVVADGIIKICLLYFFRFVDEFVKGKHGGAIKLLFDQDEHLTILEASIGYATAFGSYIINCNELSNCIIEWVFDITYLTDDGADELSFGIMEIDNLTYHESSWNTYPFTTIDEYEYLDSSNIEWCYGLWIGYKYYYDALSNFSMISNVS